MKRIIVYIIPVVWMLFIFIQSSLPADLSSTESSFFVDLICSWVKADPELVTFFVRKSAHFAEYLLLGASLLAAFVTVKREKPHKGIRTAILPAGIVGAVYAVSDEIHQRFVPGRSCELRDMIIDCIGIGTGILIMILLIRRKREREDQACVHV